MANLLVEAFAGFVGGLIASIMGYAIDIAIGAIFDAFKPINPLMPLLGLVFAIFSFFAGISKAYIAGIFFSLGIISAGWILGDFITFIAGFISIVGLVLSLFRRSSD